MIGLLYEPWRNWKINNGEYNVDFSFRGWINKLHVVLNFIFDLFEKHDLQTDCNVTMLWKTWVIVIIYFTFVKWSWVSCSNFLAIPWKCVAGLRSFMLALSERNASVRGFKRCSTSIFVVW